MTDSDEKKVRQTIIDIIGKPLAEISGQLNVLSETINNIDENTIKTNGKVAEHEKIIGQILRDELSHWNRCPNTDKIITLEKMEVGRKAVSNFSWKQVTFGAVLAGLIISIIQLLIK